MSSKGMRSVHEAACQILQKVLAAYDATDRHIGDSDLDGEQPLTLDVRLTLADIRLARHVVRS